ncbi:MAG: SDR family oxidoreductase [Actinobacteria bacterium]|nr:SDR family oxidoreductase [Actinomycetota bacterium]
MKLQQKGNQENKLNQTPKALEELVTRSQFIGADQSLVVFGGGNTSAKGEITDHLGRKRTVLWVKGSGADMTNAVAIDYPALYLEELLSLKQFEKLSDEEMTDLVGKALVDPNSRRPSIETLLHAFLPSKHIDHVHADAICALTNHPGGKKAVAEALGEDFAYVDWIRPGFELSKYSSQFSEKAGIVLAHHGLIVWDDDSEKCKNKTINAVEKANKYLDSLSVKPAAKFDHSGPSDQELSDLLLALRGRLSKKVKRVLTIDNRLQEISKRKDLAKVAEAGASSADHMLRIRPWSAVLPEKTTVENFLLLPGVGSITTGESTKEGKMLSDIAFHTHSVAAKVIDCFGEADTIGDREIFGFDYWPMELFKLSSKPKPKKFAGSVFIVTGAGSGIGRGIALELAENGANLVLADLTEDGLKKTEEEILKVKGLKPHFVVGDQSKENVIIETVQSAIKNYGGFDGAVMSAGIGVSDSLETLTLEKWNQGLAVNLTSSFLLTKHAMINLRKQGIGGSLVYIASKNAFSPGAGFGGYSVSKAGMLQLMRIAALEGGSAQIRANAINPDAIFDNSKLWEGGIREQRAKAHGVKPEELEDFYASRNMLKVHVTSKDVALTTSYLLSDDSSRTTGSVIAVDGGVAAAFPR